MKTKLAAAILCVSMLQAEFASGLGLGDIDVASGLNERFEAEIPLSNVRGLDASQILVRLASSNDFARADVERPYFLNRLKFDIRRGTSGRPVLKVSTPDVLREPYLNFLLEVRWPNGRMLREYMVLLDLPLYSEGGYGGNFSTPSIGESDEKVAATGKPQVKTRFAPELPKRQTGQVRDLPRRQVAPPSGDGTYTVKRNDSLWNIAKAYKPSGLTINQSMLALQQANPHAFINNNINLLKEGVVLRLPEAGAIASTDVSQADDLVARQEKVWSNRSRKPDADLRPLQDARSDSAVDSGPATSPQDRLTLSSDLASAADLLPKRGESSRPLISQPSASAKQAAPKAAASSDAANEFSGNSEIVRLQSELASSLENLDRASLENQSLADRIDEVESQFEDLERLLELKNKELESVKKALEQNVDAVVDQSTDQPEPQQSATPAKGVFEQIADVLSISVTTLFGALAGLLAIIVGIFLWLSSRNRDDDYSATVFDSPEPEQQRPDFSRAEVPTQVEPEEPEAELEPEAEPEQAFDGDAPTALDDELDEAEDSLEDPLSEADIYLAYGRHQQAVNMLVTAIEAEPTRTDLRMKLLEVFNDQGDSSQVEAQKSQILALDSSLQPAIQALLGDGDTISSAVDDGELNADLDLDLDTDLADESVIETPVASEPVAAEAEPAAGEVEEEVSTKLDLARAYIDMGDYDGAREIIDEVMEEGSAEQKDQAQQLLSRFS